MRTKLLSLTLVLICQAGMSYSQDTEVTGQLTFATIGSGNWRDNTIWETFPYNAVGEPGTGTPVPESTTPKENTNYPGNTSNVLVRSGHTVALNGINSDCYHLKIESGGKLWANETNKSGRRLQVAVGTSKSPYNVPVTSTIINDGELGGLTDALYIEFSGRASEITLTGSGITKLQRIRINGSLSANVPSFSLTINQDVELTQSDSYALSAYNPRATDNVTITINSGKTVEISNSGSFFYNNQINSGTGFGTYTYNINGTLDQSATNTANSSISPSGGTVNVNVSGLLKTGAIFNSSPIDEGVTNLVIKPGGVVDASLANTMTFNNSYFVTEGTGVLKRNVPNDGTEILFPIGTDSYSPVILSNTGSEGSNFSVGVKNTFDYVVADVNKVVNKQWSIEAEKPLVSDLKIGLGWNGSVQAAGFNPALPNISLIRYNGTAWEETAAAINGTDPYSAQASGFTTFGYFGVENGTLVLPLKLLAFKALPGNSLNKPVRLSWTTVNEINTKGFDIERSTNGRNFDVIGYVSSKNRPDVQSYVYNDTDPLPGISYYRLKQIDKDGKYEYSEIISVDNKTALSLSLYPNPVASILTIQYPVVNTNTQITVYGAEGKKLLHKALDLGKYETAIDISELESGIYLLELNDNTERAIAKFFKK